jgi:tetratricopeptide (TPR) repeat protein
MSEHELWNELGNLYFMSGAYNQAIYAYHRSIQLDGNFGRPYSNLALTYVQQGKYEEAIELYRSSIELLADNKEKAISWSRLGNVYRHLKDYSKAVVAYQQADELDPQVTADILPQPTEEILPQSTEDTQPQTTPDNLPQGTEDIVPQSVEIFLPQSAEANCPSSEVLPQAEEIVEVLEESGQRDSGVPEPTSTEENQAFSPESVSEANPISYGDSDPESETHEATLADSSLYSPLPDELVLPSNEELWPGMSSEPNQVALDESTSSWALADLPRYQEDLSESPETGSLTIWGEPDTEEEDWDLYPSPDPEPDVHLPDTDGDGLTRWVPIPIEEPGNELDALEPVEETQGEMPQPEIYLSPLYQVNETVDCQQSSTGVLPQETADVSLQSSMDIEEQIVAGYQLALPSKSSAHRTDEYSEPTVQLLEVEVEERPSAITPSQFIPEFVLTDEPEDQALEAQTDTDETQPFAIRLERDEEEKQELEASIAKFKRAVQTNPRNAYAWDALGTLYKSAGLYKDAILAYQQATSINPPKALYFHNLGLVYACEGRDEDAIGAFQKVVEIDPDYSLAHATLGGYYRKMGQEELAQQHIGKAMKNIFDSENEYNRACLEAICGNADHAIELLGVALRNKQTYVDWILRDPDLDFIRQDPRFKQLVSDYTR